MHLNDDAASQNLYALGREFDGYLQENAFLWCRKTYDFDGFLYDEDIIKVSKKIKFSWRLIYHLIRDYFNFPSRLDEADKKKSEIIANGKEDSRKAMMAALDDFKNFDGPVNQTVVERIKETISALEPVDTISALEPVDTKSFNAFNSALARYYSGIVPQQATENERQSLEDLYLKVREKIRACLPAFGYIPATFTYLAVSLQGIHSQEPRGQ